MAEGRLGGWREARGWREQTKEAESRSKAKTKKFQALAEVFFVSCALVPLLRCAGELDCGRASEQDDGGRAGSWPLRVIELQFQLTCDISPSLSVSFAAQVEAQVEAQAEAEAEVKAGEQPRRQQQRRQGYATPARGNLSKLSGRVGACIC